ncbi:PAS domain S-box protein [Treponema phagedenis]|nr:PAS domain S-box protein [Treponema phagedenis]QSH95847.1 PAS domain-containing sensor histidine kinase [Treponema phagedenis]
MEDSMREFISRAINKSSKMNEAQLRDLIGRIAEEYSLLEAMMDSLSNGVIVLDSFHTAVKTNRAAARILGRTFHESSDKPFWEYIDDEKIAAFISSVIQNEEGETTEEFILSRDSGSRYIEISVLPLVEEHRVRGTIILLEDITQKKRTEINHRRLESLASLTNLAAAVAHEIKNPLAAISIHVQLLRKNFKACDLHINEKAQKHLNVVEEEIDRLNKIVVNFLFAVRPLQVELAPVNINKIINDLHQTFLDEFKKSGVYFSLRLDKTIPIIQGDERLLRQAFMNFLTNAKAAMKTGGALIIYTTWKDDFIEIYISDTGQGISEENLHKIFEPYFSTKSDGTGLGLTMAYKVIKEHNGDIHVDSVVGEGTCFTVYLPIHRHENQLLLENKNEMNDPFDLTEKTKSDKKKRESI